MSTGFVYHDRFLDHDTGRGHPERPDRLRAITRRLREAGLWDRLTHLPFDPATRADAERLHTPAYLDRLAAACRDGASSSGASSSGGSYIDTPDSAIGRESAEVAYLALGGVLAAVDAVATGTVNNAFCAVRPPGHHAEADRSMGFCLLANAAFAADGLLSRHSLSRVAVVDFDVHHGNGTQHLFERRRDVLFISLHQDPRTCYPGTGFVHETGRGDGAGFTLNLPLPPGGGDDVYLRTMVDTVLPRLDTYRPEALVISAGFDAAAADPLAGMSLTTAGFRGLTDRLLAAADRHCGGRVVSVLEGGYDLDALAAGVETHVAALLQAGDPSRPG